MEMFAMLLLSPLFTHKCQTRASDFARQPIRLYRYYHSAASSFRIRSIRYIVPSNLNVAVRFREQRILTKEQLPCHDVDRGQFGSY
uniref:Putative secreted protein n=1 Tax=Ixodes scapularis TaxID=6945 RepID=A0A4D5REJ1_IXOSC